MASYLMMGKFTDAGIKNVKETIKRSENFKDMAQKCGVTIKEIMWLMGDHDVFCIAEAADDNAITSMLLSAGSRGFVTTSTHRAFSKDEIGTIVGKMV